MKLKVGRSARRLMMTATGILALGGSLAACGSSSASGSTSTTAATPVVVNESMVLMTGSMIKKPGWPMIQPADITVPKGATVNMTIYSYDDGAAALPSSLAMYYKATGVTNLTENGQAVTTATASNLAHTYTIPTLGINVPIEATVAAGASGRTPMVVTFTFKADKSGTFTWQCYAPCGSGSDGMGGAMVTSGYMKGSLTVA